MRSARRSTNEESRRDRGDPYAPAPRLRLVDASTLRSLRSRACRRGRAIPSLRLARIFLGQGALPHAPRDEYAAHAGTPSSVVLHREVAWVPFAQVLISVAQDHDRLMSDESSLVFRLAIWGIQILIGLVGVLLVGKLAVEEAKRAGWRQTPRHLWRLFWRGSEAL